MNRELTTGRLVAAVGGAALIVSLFLDWYSLSVLFSAGSLPATSTASGSLGNASIAVSANAWKAFHYGDIFLFAVGVLAITPAAISQLESDISLPFEPGQATSTASTIAVLF